MVNPRRTLVIAFGLLVMSVAVSTGYAQEADLAEASRTYKANRSYKSLAILTEAIAKGTPRDEIERLLGEPDYSPIDGQFYYASDTKVVMDADLPRFTLVLVVDYRDETGEVTEELQQFFLGPVGE